MHVLLLFVGVDGFLGACQPCTLAYTHVDSPQELMIQDMHRDENKKVKVCPSHTKELE